MKQESLYDYKYEDTPEDLKFKAFIELCMPDEVPIASIRRRTHLKMQKRKRQRFAIISSIAAVFIGIFVITTASLLPSGSNFATEQEYTLAEELVSVKVPIGEKMTIMLADGTKVVANSRSEIRYPKVFSGNTREVYAKGEVYFEVAHDKSHPFIVDADGLKIKVLGTKFCVNNHNSSHTTVALLEGCVAAMLKGGDTVTMHPNKLLSVQNGAFLRLEDIDASDYTNWMEGVINLHGDDLHIIVDRLNDYYGTEVHVDNRVYSPSLYGKLIYQKDIDSVLESINEIAGTRTVTINGKKTIVE